MSGAVGHVAHQHRVLRVAGQQLLVIRLGTLGVTLPVVESGQLMIGVEVRRVTRTQLQQVALCLVCPPDGSGGACERHKQFRACGVGGRATHIIMVGVAVLEQAFRGLSRGIKGGKVGRVRVRLSQGQHLSKTLLIDHALPVIALRLKGLPGKQCGKGEEGVECFHVCA